MRPRSRPLSLAIPAVGASALATVALIAPASAAAQQPERATAGLPAAPERAVLGDGERRRATEPRRRPGAEGPFAPVIGEVDYGTAENSFGAARSGHVHAGHDLFAPAGTPLVAVADAEVVEAGSDGGRGNFIALHDARRKVTYVYFHMNEPATAKAGSTVKAGERVGSVGCTGSCWGDHLHFEVRRGADAYGEAIDPAPLLEDWERLEQAR